MRKFIITGVAVAMLAVPTAAMADVSNNGTTSDAYGYCVANYNHANGDLNGIGSVRSGQTGKEVSADAGKRAPALCVYTQGWYPPISSK